MQRILAEQYLLWSFFGVLLVHGGLAHAQDVPIQGIVYNTRDSASVTYFCDRTNAGLLACDFNQTSIRKKAKPSDLAVTLKRAQEMYQKGERLHANVCATLKDTVDMLDGRKQLSKEYAGLSQLNDLERRDTRASLVAGMDACRSPSEQNYARLARVSHDRDTRTCRASSNFFKQEFQLVRDDVKRSATWVNRSGPEGPCGIVQLNRFDLDKSDDSKLQNWKYIARKAVTNPQGIMSFAFGQMACTTVDESEYVYDWRNKVEALGCDYIEFSPL